MYNVEIFDMYTRTFVDAFVAGDELVIRQDMLTDPKFNITAPANLTCDIRNTLQIKKDGSRYFSGYIVNIERDNYKTVLTVAPLKMLLNDVSIQNTTYSDWRRQIDQQIYYDYTRSSPSLYKLPFLRYGDTSFSNWDGVQCPYGDGLYNNRDGILLAATSAGKFMNFGIGTSAAYLGVPHYGFKKFTTVRVIEADLENVIEKEINVTSRNSYNICIIWVRSMSDPTQWLYYTVVYYNGELFTGSDATRKKRLLTEPRVISKAYDQQTTFSVAKQKEIRMQTMKPERDKYDITLTVKIDDRIIDNPISWSFGQPVTIISGGKEYSTYYTGREISGDIIKMKFGMTRQSLTSILNDDERTN